MAKIPLYTSLPPAMHRFDPSGREFGREYQADCLRSWDASGFETITVNSSLEFLGRPDETPGIGRVVFERDARTDAGKPLIYLDDFIGRILGSHDGAIGITNADIVLHFDDEMQERLRLLSPGEAFFLNRVDVSRPGSRAGTLYGNGIDFFGVHTDDLRRIDVGQMVLGMPWWDHLVPVLMLANGVRRLQPTRLDQVFHLRHEERWDVEQWLRFGKRFRRHVLSRLDADQHPAAAGYLKAIQSAGSMRATDALKTAFQMQTREGRRARTTRELNGITAANCRFIDGLI